ncbi:MAG: acyltransferase [Mucilaginibacter sp.]
MAFNKIPVPQAKIKLVSEAIAEKYYPSLNGLRGAAIIMVVFSHLALSWYKWYVVFFDGGLGVNIFFVLSGFLITSLCLKEQKTTGTLSLKSFYIRRMLRIFPVAYLYLAVLFVLDVIFHLQIPVFQYLGAMFYVMDLSYFRRNHFTPEVSHYWSLSVEEQFYIVFPFILKRSRRAFYYAVLFIVLVLPLLCGLQELFKPLNEGVFYLFTHILVKFQSIATGCLLAILAFNKQLDYKWLFRYKVVINILAIFLLFYLGYDTFYSFKSVCVNLIIAALTGYIIVSNMVPSRDWIFRILNSSVLSIVGILSYSIYIWQQLFTFGSAKLPKYMVTFPGNIIFIVVISSLSYFFYEKYFLTLKSKFSRLRNKQPIVMP